jgi:hypothetical protein
MLLATTTPSHTRGRRSHRFAGFSKVSIAPHCQTASARSAIVGGSVFERWA